MSEHFLDFVLLADKRIYSKTKRANLFSHDPHCHPTEKIKLADDETSSLNNFSQRVSMI